MLSALTIAGSDPTGGAGLQADLQVFRSFGVHGGAVPTALTIQDGLRVGQVLPVFPSSLLEMLRTTIGAIRPAAIKIGMLGTDDAVRNTTLALGPFPDVPIVIDPILMASDGSALLERRAYPALRDLAFRRTLLTPNWPEMETLVANALPRRRDGEAAARFMHVVAVGKPSSGAGLDIPVNVSLVNLLDGGGAMYIFHDMTDTRERIEAELRVKTERNTAAQVFHRFLDDLNLVAGALSEAAVRSLASTLHR